MKASRTLPQGYEERGEITLKNKTTLFWLNVFAVPWFLCCAWFFGMITNVFKPLNFAIMAHVVPVSSRFGALEAILIVLVALFVTMFVVLLLHELTHGFFFWLFTRSRPVYGFKGWYAYAAAPGWYLSRWPFLIVLSTPLILLSLLGEALMFVVPGGMSLLLLWGLIVNAGGAIGDLYMIARLLLFPRATVLEDSGAGIKWYTPAA